MQPGVSIIICCHNSAKLLPQTLANLKAQKNEANVVWEVIVVDNASTDETSRVSLSLWPEDALAPLRVVRESRLGISYARHKGFSEARYELCGWIDHDNWVNPDWIKTAFEVMNNHPEVGACGGLNEAVCEIEPPEWFERYKYSYAIGPQGAKSGYVPEERGFLWGAGLVIRKSAWQSLVDRGFSNILTGRKGRQILSGDDEEITLALQLANWKLWYEPRLKLKHYLSAERLNWKTLRRLHRSFGASSVVFDVYRYLLKSAANTPPNSWMQLCMQNAKVLLYYSLIFAIKSFILRREDRVHILCLERQWGRFLTYLYQRRKYDQSYNSINSLRNKLKKGKFEL